MRTAQRKTSIHPLSICILIGFCFLATFAQMQKRFVAYQTSDHLKELRLLREQKALLEMDKAKVQRPMQVQKLAERLTMRKADFDQVIIMTPQKGSL